MKKKILGLISILVIVVLMFTAKKEVSNINAEKEQATGEIISSGVIANHGLIIYADDLIKDSTAEADIKSNTEYLQKLVDEVSGVKGGTVKIPAGTYYFAPGGKGVLDSEYVINCKSFVTIEGSGNNETTGTILKPYGTTTNGLSMFYFNEYEENNNVTYLENADFSNFVINGENATGENFVTAGKGFAINLHKNCDFENITVKNTDGTGFGLDNPINATIKNCKAEGCGKHEDVADIGGSGFGIGTGYSIAENIYISNCEAKGNKNYGFFFEHQGIYKPDLYSAKKSTGFVVADSVAEGNKFNFGGGKAYDITYINCKTRSIDENGESYNFMDASVRSNVINGRGDVVFSDVTDSTKYWYEPIYWAYNNGITAGYTKNEFAPDDPCLRKNVVSLLYRMAGRPGNITFEEQKTGFEDIDNIEGEKFDINAIMWAVENEYIVGLDLDSTTFAPNEGVYREDFMTMLWRLAGKPEPAEGSDMPDVEEGAYYEKAFDWAVGEGIIKDVTAEKFTPETVIARKDVITYLYRYANAKNTFSITYNLQGGVENSTGNPTTYNPDKVTEKGITLNNPTREGYTFKGWIGKTYNNTDESGVCVPEAEITITTEDRGNKSYTAIWSANRYTVSFNSNGGTGEMPKQSFEYDMPRLLLPNEFTREGYVFAGWSILPDGEVKYTNAQTINNLTTNIGEEIVLYAQWQKIDSEENSSRTNIFIGSGSWVEMHNIIGENGDKYSASRSENIDWLKNTGIPAIESEIKENTNVILKIGSSELFYEGLNNGVIDVNGVAEKYARYLNSKIVKWLNRGANVYIVSIGPYDEEKVEATGRTLNNTDAESFNAKLQSELNGEIYIDTYTSMKAEIEANPDLTREDGTNGIPLYYSKLYKIIKDKLGQTYTPTNEALNNMNDVAEDATYYVPVKWAYENAYMNPATETTFNPNGKLTRGEAISLIWKSQKIPYVSNSDKFEYTDVEKDSIYYNAVMWGAEKNITYGFTPPIYAPDVNCARGYYMMFIWRLAGAPAVTTGNNFTDVEAGENYTDAINWAVSEGIINKDLDGEFRPLEDITREEAITFLYNYYHKGKISYNLFGGTLSGNTNPTRYISGIDTFTLNNPTKEGSIFIGWTGSNGEKAQTNVTITKEAKGDLNYTANWGDGKVSYTVEHYLQNIDDNEYTLDENATQELEGTIGDKVNPNKEYEGFTVVEGTETVELTEDEQVIKCYYTRNEHLVQVVLGEGSTGIIRIETKGLYKYGEKVELGAVLKDGYDKDTVKWSGDYTTHVFAMPDREVMMTVTVEPIKYTITYNLDDGINNPENPTEYTVEDEITLKDPTKEGYVFEGWTGSNGEEPKKGVEIKDSTGELTYTANWSDGSVQYTIEHYLQNIENDEYTLDENATQELGGTIGDEVTPNKEYEGFTVVEGTETVELTENGQVIKCYYTRNSYTVEIFNRGGVKQQEKKQYRFGQTVVIQLETEKGWRNPSVDNILPFEWLDAEKTKFLMPAENVMLEVSAQLIPYSISYDLRDGIDPGNPTEYNVMTNDITLKQPTKEGYIFTGWTGFNGETPETQVTIPTGTTGNLTFTANWVIATTKFNVEITKGKGIEEVTGDGEYEVGAQVTLDATVKEGYDENSITWSGDSTFVMPAEDVSITVSATPITYTITYSEDGKVEGNPTTYTVETEGFTLINPTKEGYEFIGWTGSNGTTPQTTVTIPNGNIGNLTYTANWEVAKVKYTIEYYKQLLDGTYSTIPDASDDTRTGSIGEEITVPVDKLFDGFTAPQEQTIELSENSEDNVIKYYYIRNSYNITVTEGTGIDRVEKKEKYKYGETVELQLYYKTGYSNAIWSGNYNSNEFPMPAKDVVMEVNATPIQYTITYNLDGGNVEGNPTKYTVESEDFTLINPKRTGYTFIGWTGSNGSTPQKQVKIEKGTTGDLTYTANWKVAETETPKELNVGISYSTKELTNKDVTVIISANNKIEPVEGWTLSEDEKSISKIYEQNGSETVTIVDEYGNEKEQLVEVTNIDKIPPEVEITYEEKGDHVIVTAKTNEKVREVEGWKISEDKQELTKIYYVNKEEEFTFTDLAGNETKKTVKITSIVDPEDDGKDDAGDGNGENNNGAGTGDNGSGNNNKPGNTTTDKDSTGGDKTDTTVSNKDIPAAGLKYILGTGIMLIVLGVLSFAKMKKYKDIK